MTKSHVLIGGALLFCFVLGVVQNAAPVHGDEESITAGVTVRAPVAESYGATIVASSRVLLRWRALGEPDGRGAWMLRGGRISIELEDMVTDCSDVSIWAAKRGWRSPRFTVYVSADGSNWTYIGGARCTSRRYVRYDFGGDFGEVKYIGVRRAGQWSVLLLDAAWAKVR